jgi:hypothetical protein
MGREPRRVKKEEGNNGEEGRNRINKTTFSENLEIKHQTGYLTKT